MASTQDSRVHYTNHVSVASEYYEDVLPDDDLESFVDLDDPNDASTSIAAIKGTSSFNFLVDFSDDAARASLNIHTSTVAKLLEAERPAALNTRWLNIWYPAQQQPLLEVVAKRYEFSPRLLALMCSQPRQVRVSQTPATSTGSPRSKTSLRRKNITDPDVLLEKGLDELSELSSLSSGGSVTATNLYEIIDDLWHYTSVDIGRNYICIGYNSLYGTKRSGEDPGAGILPHCTRVWTWLLLCEDNTIISICEDPFPFVDSGLTLLQQRIISETRRNIVSVFRSLCNEEPSNPNTPTPMTHLPLRSRLGNTPAETAHRSTDVPGLLFYYIFENWQNSYTLITRRESRYGVELSSIRREMFTSPKLCHIDRLDSLGKELGVLKRHYASYNRIIDRLLEHQSASTASLQNSQIVAETDMTATSQTSLDTVRPIVAERDSMLGVSLSTASRVRFKRLRDLIDLYALSEVEEYIKQKDSLVTMNFNLIAIKESHDVERLTRLTLLLTKVTMIFLPVSLMTGYFSVPLQGLEYGIRDYWISFAVVLFASGMMLFTVGFLTGTVQVLDILKAIGRRVKACIRRLLERM